MVDAQSLISPVDADEAYGFIEAPKYRVKYPEGVTDDYGQTSYYFRTKRGALRMAREAAKAAVGDVISLTKDWTK